MASDVFVHPTAICESDSVGSGSRVWAFAHVMPGAVIGRDCNLGNYVFVESGCRIGDRVTVKNGVQLWDGITLEDDVMIGPCAVFTNDRFPRSPRAEAVAERYSDKRWLDGVVVRRGATVGANATIMAGVEIGSYALVAAGAIVTRDVGAHELVRGVPARPAGLVCVCATPLDGDQQMMRCPSCRRAYRLENGQLRQSE